PTIGPIAIAVSRSVISAISVPIGPVVGTVIGAIGSVVIRGAIIAAVIPRSDSKPEGHCRVRGCGSERYRRHGQRPQCSFCKQLHFCLLTSKTPPQTL